MSPTRPSKHHNHAFGLSLLVSAVFIAAIVLLAPFRFETNDDPVMLLIASGAYTGTPDEHLVFIHVAIGFVLKFLYQHVQGIEFYTIAMLAAHVYATAVILTFIVQLRLEKAAVVLLTLLLLAFEFAAITRLQFTVTSGILASAAVIQLLQKSKWPKWVGHVTFMLAVCFRFEAAMLVLIISAPMLLNQVSLSQGVKIIMLLVCAGTTLKAIDEAYYQKDPAWQNYKTYDKARGMINDNPNEQKFASSSEAEQNDYLLLLRFIPNPASLSTARLQEIAEILKNTPMTEKIQNIKNTWTILGTPMLLLLLIFTFIVFGLPKQDRWLAATVIVLYALLCIYISLNSTFKPRVFSTSTAPLLFAYLPYFLKKIHQNRLIIPLYIGVFAFSSGLTHASVKEIKSNAHRSKIVTEQIQLVKNYYRDSDKKIYTVILKSEYLDPLKLSNSLKKYPIVYGGWLTNAPFPHQLRSFEGLPNTAMLVSKADLATTVPMVLLSTRNNHDIDLEFKVIGTSEGFVIIDFQRKKFAN